MSVLLSPVVVNKLITISKEVGKQFNASSWYCREDLEQDMLVKIISTLKKDPTLHFTTEEHFYSWARVCMRNRTHDFFRKWRKRTFNTNPYFSEGNEFILDACSLYDSMPQNFISPTSAASYSSLIKVCRDWAKTQADDICNVVVDLIQPSESTLAIWDQLTSGGGRYMAYETIPPSTLAKIHGVKKIRVTKAVERLRVHLTENGF